MKLKMQMKIKEKNVQVTELRQQVHHFEIKHAAQTQQIPQVAQPKDDSISRI